MKNRLTTAHGWEFLLIPALFCFAVSLFNKGGYIYVAVAALMLFFNIRWIRIGLAEWLLFIFSFAYFGVFACNNKVTIPEVVYFLIGPWSAYILGRLYVERSGCRNPLMVLVVTLAAGMCIHGLLNWVAYVQSSHILYYSYRRIAVDFWQKEIASVTVTGMYYVFATGISLGALFSPTKRLIKIVAVITLSLCILATVFFANRTLLVIVFCIVLFRTAILFLSRKYPDKNKVFIFLAIVAVFGLISAAYVFNWFGIQNWVQSLKLVERRAEAGRLVLWAEFFDDLAFMKYPFGGKYLTQNANLTYMHNLWLDIYNVAGVFAFIPFVIFTGMMIARYCAFRKAMLAAGEVSTYICFQCLLIALALNCLVEPIVEANPYYLMIVLAYLGAMNGQMNVIKRTLYNEDSVC